MVLVAVELQAALAGVDREDPEPQRVRQESPAVRPEAEGDDEGEDRPGEVQHRVQQVAPGRAALEDRAHPRHRAVLLHAQRLGVGDVQAEQPAGPRPLQRAETAAAGQRARQDRHPEERDQQARAQRHHRDGVGEEQDADRQAQQDIAQLPPAACLDRCAQRGRQPAPRPLVGDRPVHSVPLPVLRGHRCRPVLLVSAAVLSYLQTGRRAAREPWSPSASRAGGFPYPVSPCPRVPVSRCPGVPVSP